MNSKAKRYAALHALLLFYSSAGVLGKLAAQQMLFSIPFVILYGLEFLVLGIYAIAWQQVLKHMNLSAAYANRGALIIWGCFWGVILFHEQLTVGKVVGGILVSCGVVLYGIADGKTANDG